LRSRCACVEVSCVSVSSRPVALAVADHARARPHSPPLSWQRDVRADERELAARLAEFRAADFTGAVFLSREFAAEHPVALLTAEQVAIHLLTQDTPLYVALNAVMRSRTRALLKPFFPLLKLVLGGLYKKRLPAALQTVYRGVKLNVTKQYRVGRTVVWWAFTSTSGRPEVASDPEFAGGGGERTIFEIKTRRLVSITDCSAYGAGEDERLLLPGTLLTVTAVELVEPGLHKIVLEDKDGPPLLDYRHPMLAVNLRVGCVFALHNLLLTPVLVCFSQHSALPLNACWTTYSSRNRSVTSSDCLLRPSRPTPAMLLPCTGWARVSHAPCSPQPAEEPWGKNCTLRPFITTTSLLPPTTASATHWQQARPSRCTTAAP
jgi:hypothetical protein